MTIFGVKLPSVVKPHVNVPIDSRKVEAIVGERFGKGRQDVNDISEKESIFVCLPIVLGQGDL